MEKTCAECNELLSCRPLEDEICAASCEVCNPQLLEQDEDGTSNSSECKGAGRIRSILHEAATRFLSFSRPEKMASSSLQPDLHHRDCPFRTFVCPIVERGSCDWVGPRLNLQEHCEEAHPEHVFESPCLIPRPDLTRSHLKNYLISAFNSLFLLQLKVCLTTGKLCHTVRILNGFNFSYKFYYSLKIDGNNNKLTQSGPILETGLMMLQEPSAFCTSINSLLEAFSGRYEETQFTLTINSILNSSCLICSKNIVFNSEYCEDCPQKLIKCDFNLKGCLFVDVNTNKCIKHKLFFCKFQTKCTLPRGCGGNFEAGSFIEHLGSCQNTIKAKLNSVFRITTTSVDSFIILSSDNFGTIICKYYLVLSSFKLWLCSSFPFWELKKLKCSIELTDPETNYTEIKTPDIRENTLFDWSIHDNMNSFPSCGNVGIDLKINITKIE